MDIFDSIPDDYVSKNPLTDDEAQEITNYLKNHPLFLKEVPDNIQQNQHLVALQFLKDSPEDLVQQAQSLNNQGNDIIKKNPDNIHHQKKAFQKYTEAIELKTMDKELNAKLHCNRASINLKLKNYGKVIIDCRIALKFNENYTKAYFRLAKAYAAVGKQKQALQALKGRQQEELLQLKKQIQAQINKRKAKEATKIQTANKQLNTVEAIIKARKYNVIKRPEPLPQNAKIELAPDGKSLIIPVLFAYPEFSQMDLVAKATQQGKIRAYLQNEIFSTPLPWDQKGEYTLENCEMYFEMNENVIMKVPKQAKIGQIAKRVVLRGALQISILAKDNQFYKEFMKGKQLM